MSNNNPRIPTFTNTNSVRVLASLLREPEVSETNYGTRAEFHVGGVELVQDGDRVREVPFYERVSFIKKRAEDALALGLKPGDAVFLDGDFRAPPKKGHDGEQRNELVVEYGLMARALGCENMPRRKDQRGEPMLVGGYTRAVIVGKIVGKGADLRYTPQGAPVANFSVACRTAWKEDEWVNHTAFVEVNMWRDMALQYAEHAVKGIVAEAEGRVNRGSYTNKEGRKVYTTRLEASRLTLSDPQPPVAAPMDFSAPPARGAAFFESEEDSLPF